MSHLNPPSESLTPDITIGNNGSLPARPAPKLFASHDAQSGTGTPIGFQRPQNKAHDHAAHHPSPQPTHMGIPGTPHRVLPESGPGYIAAKFEGKQKQMEQGEFPGTTDAITEANSLSHGPARG